MVVVASPEPTAEHVPGRTHAVAFQFEPLAKREPQALCLNTESWVISQASTSPGLELLIRPDGHRGLTRGHPAGHPGGKQLGHPAIVKVHVRGPKVAEFGGLGRTVQDGAAHGRRQTAQRGGQRGHVRVRHLEPTRSPDSRQHGAGHPSPEGFRFRFAAGEDQGVKTGFGYGGHFLCARGGGYNTPTPLILI